MALMDPANLLLPGMSGLPSLAQPFPCPACALGKKLHGCVCTVARGVPHAQRSLCGSSVGSQGPAQPLWVSVGTAGTGQAAREAARLVLLPGCCGWMWVQPTRECMLTAHVSCRQGGCSFQTRADFLPSLEVLAVPRHLGMSVCCGHCRCSAVSGPGMAAGTHRDSSDCSSPSECLSGAVIQRGVRSGR